MSLTLLGEESPQFVCLEHPESCILSIKNFLVFFFKLYCNILLKCSVLCSWFFAFSYMFSKKSDLVI